MCPAGYNQKQDLLSTKKNYIYALDNAKINLGHDVELGVTKIFEREIWALRKVETLKQELMSFQDYSMLEIFRCIDQYAHGYINQDNLRVFLRGFDFCADIDEEDLLNYIRRYDRDVDKQLDYADFVRALGPYCQYNQRAEMSGQSQRNNDSLKDGKIYEDDEMIQNSYQKIDASSERIQTQKVNSMKAMPSGRALSRLTKTTAASVNATKVEKYRMSGVQQSVHAQSEKPYTKMKKS